MELLALSLARHCSIFSSTSSLPSKKISSFLEIFFTSFYYLYKKPPAFNRFQSEAINKKVESNVLVTHLYPFVEYTISGLVKYIISCTDLMKEYSITIVTRQDS